MDLLKSVNNQLNEREEAGSAWSDDAYEILLKAVQTDMTRAEIKNLAAELIEKHDNIRDNKGGVEMALIRMHVIAHGFLPTDIVSEASQNFFKVPDKMLKFGKAKGLDVEERVKKARADLEQRVAKEKKKLSKDAARSAMAAYYKEVKDTFSPQEQANLKKNRDKIISDLMSGTSAEEAFENNL